MSMDHTYKVIELVGSSPVGVEAAINNAIQRASQSLQGLDWFEVKEIRGNIQAGKIAWYQVKLGVGFRIMDPADLQQD